MNLVFKGEKGKGEIKTTKRMTEEEIGRAIKRKKLTGNQSKKGRVRI